MGKVDCRACKHFMPLWKLPKELVLEVEREARRYNIRPLGYCLKFRKAVTYFEGYCGGFTPKREVPEGQKSLLIYLS